jgi:hypothetical protein
VAAPGARELRRRNRRGAVSASPPLRPVIYHVRSNRALYRRLVIFYGARAPAELL